MEMNVVIENAGKAENVKKTVVSAPNPLASPPPKHDHCQHGGPCPSVAFLCQGLPSGDHASFAILLFTHNAL